MICFAAALFSFLAGAFIAVLAVNLIRFLDENYPPGC